MRFSMVDTLKEAVARSSSMPSLEEGQNLWEAVTDDRTIFGKAEQLDSRYNIYH